MDTENLLQFLYDVDQASQTQDDQLGSNNFVQAQSAMTDLVNSPNFKNSSSEGKLFQAIQLQ